MNLDKDLDIELDVSHRLHIVHLYSSPDAPRPCSDGLDVLCSLLYVCVCMCVSNVIGMLRLSVV